MSKRLKIMSLGVINHGMSLSVLYHGGHFIGGGTLVPGENHRPVASLSQGGERTS